jgi:hypothetical protein
VSDFAPVAILVEQPLVLVTRKDLAPVNLDEFIAYTKANQATMQYGSAGVGSGSHLGCAQLNAAMGANTSAVAGRLKTAGVTGSPVIRLSQAVRGERNRQMGGHHQGRWREPRLERD